MHAADASVGQVGGVFLLFDAEIFEDVPLRCLAYAFHHDLDARPGGVRHERQQNHQQKGHGLFHVGDPDACAGIEAKPEE